MQKSKSNDILTKLIRGASDTGDSKSAITRDASKLYSRHIISASKDSRTAKEKPISSSLSSNEKIRTVNIARIWHEEYFKQLKKSSPDSKEKTKIATPITKTKAIVLNTNRKKRESDTGGIFGLLGKLPFASALLKFGAIGAIATGIFFLADWVQDVLGPVAQFFIKLPGRLAGIFKTLGGIQKLGKMIMSIARTVGRIPRHIAKFISGFKIFSKIPLIGKALTRTGASIGKMLSGAVLKIGGKLLKFLKFLPFVGALVSFGFAWSRWKKGEYFMAILEFISGVLNILPFGVTQIASMILDGVIMLIDLTKSDKSSSSAESTSVAGTSSGGSFLDKVKQFMGSKIGRIMRYLPIIGTAMYLIDASDALFAGNWSEGFKNLGWAMISLIPGGVAIAKGLMYISSLFTSKKDVPADVRKEPGIWDDIGSKIGGFIKKQLKNLPIIGTGMWVFEAGKSFLSGKWSDGLISLSKGIISLLPGGGIIVKGLMWLGGLLEENTNNIQTPIIEKFDFIKGIVSAASRTVLKGIQVVTGWAKSAAETVYRGAEGVASGIFSIGKGTVKLASTAKNKMKKIATSVISGAKKFGKWLGVVDSPEDRPNYKRSSITEQKPPLSPHVVVIDKVANRKRTLMKNVVSSIIDPINEILDEAENKLLAYSENRLSTYFRVETENRSIKVLNNRTKPSSSEITGILNGIKTGISESNMYLRSIAEHIKTSTSGGNKNINISTRKQSSSDNESRNSIPFSDGRSDYFSSPYSLNVSGHNIMA